MPDKSASPTPPPPPSAPPERPGSGATSRAKSPSSKESKETSASSASASSTPASSTSAASGRTPGSSSAAWITAGAAGVVLAALLLVYFAFLVPAKNDRTNPSSAGNLTSDEKKAVVAAGTSAANLLTFTRAHFDRDYTRALAGTTGQLRTDVAGKKSVTLKAMTQGKFDLGAQVTHQALEGPAEGKQKGYLVLVTINGYRSTTKTQPVQQNLEVTVVDVKGTWLASDVRNIGSV